ncbi:MAG TPA: AMP-binding protein [Allosphingosinicella sp.]|jgi:acyl-CoA synthetase (AMP-forming)/AMP-acid ligase II
MRTDQTIAFAIHTQLAAFPDRVLMRYLQNGDHETAALTGADIETAGRRVAGGLGERGLAGCRALIVMETGPDFLGALVGCLYAGVVAVPAPEPRPGASLDRLERIAAACRPAIVIASPRIGEQLRLRALPGSVLFGVPTVDVDRLAEGGAPVDCPGLALDPRRPAILQYTSGTTGVPRGVILDNHCLLANIAASSRGMDVGQGEAPELLVNWMPHHHDMGLVGKILTPLVNGLETVHMSPLAFVQRPARWLTAISRYRATTSGAPAFALDLCTRRVPDEILDELDLSSWRTAFCGAEPVFASTLAAFRRRFARAGLRPEAVFTCYGLAETTLYAAGAHRPSLHSEPELPPAGARAPCYLDAASRAAIQIVGPGGRPLGEGEEGEIWIRGSSVAAGYFRDEDATREVFRARTEPDDGHEWLRSGDLGRIDGDRLSVTGRIKDVLIAEGVNVAAVDVERCATGALPDLNADAAAAFQVAEEEGGPIILLVERQRGAAAEIGEREALHRARAALFRDLGVTLAELHILRPGSLSRTTSGKIRRGAARDLWIGEQSMAEAS